MQYLAFLRGVNVGGNATIKMAELKVSLEKAGFNNVRTYIQTGNILFDSVKANKIILTQKIEAVIEQSFGLKVRVLVIDHMSYKRMIIAVPKNWGEDRDWKYNLLFLIPPFNMKEVVATIGELKPDAETLTVGEGVLYQSLSIKLFGRTTTGKLASSPIYQQMTIRNWNTARKLLVILEQEA